MYMEAYGSVGNWADSITKMAALAVAGDKTVKEALITKQALSKQGSSLSEGEGGSPKATPNAETPTPQANDINEELMASEKARKSLERKVANWQAKAQYQKSLAGLYKKELWNYKKRETVGVK